MSSKIKVYISGQITARTAQENDLAFNDAALKLEAMGFEPVSPWAGDEGMTWEQYMKRDIQMMMDCDMIFMLENWDMSKGACIERSLALQLHYPVLYETRMDAGDYDLYRWWRADTGICSKILSVDEHIDSL